MIAASVGAVTAVFTSRGTEWQLLQNYQYRRIDTFLRSHQRPARRGLSHHAKPDRAGIGRLDRPGLMEGTQSRLNFLPEKHTDFIFTTLAEEFGFVGAASLLVLYILILVFCIATALMNRDRYASLLVMGIAVAFFLYFAINMAMVMGLAPVVGVPAAAGQLRRIGDAGLDGRLRSGAKRAYPPTALTRRAPMTTILFAARSERWDAYEAPLRAALLRGRDGTTPPLQPTPTRRRSDPTSSTPRTAGSPISPPTRGSRPC